MYKKQVPYKDFYDKPKNATVYFNLTEREVFKLLVELMRINKWYESMAGEQRDLNVEEVVEFYNDLETVLLAAWGEPSDDGQHFRKGGRYEFEESAIFNACIVEFVTNPAEIGTLLDAITPEGMADLVKKSEENIAALEAAQAEKPNADPVQAAEIARLRAQLAAAETTTSSITEQAPQ